MTDLRTFARIALLGALAACSAPTPQQRIEQAELNDLAALKRQYPEVVSGFDLRLKNTVIVSLDLQHYIEMDDDAVDALKRDTLARWRAAWITQHPHAHAVLLVRFIDFIGRRVADESTKV
jgi:hypothetical protein